MRPRPALAVWLCVAAVLAARASVSASATASESAEHMEAARVEGTLCDNNTCPYPKGVCCAGGAFCCPHGAECLPLDKAGKHACRLNPKAPKPEQTRVDFEAKRPFTWEDVDFATMTPKERELAIAARMAHMNATQDVQAVEREIAGVTAALQRLEQDRVNNLKRVSDAEVSRIRAEVHQLRSELSRMRAAKQAALDAAEQRVKTERRREQDAKQAAEEETKAEATQKRQVRVAEEQQKRDRAKVTEQRTKNDEAAAEVKEQRDEAVAARVSAERRAMEAEQAANRSREERSKAEVTASERLQKAQVHKEEQDKLLTQARLDTEARQRQREQEMREAEQTRKKDKADMERERQVAENARKAERRQEEQDRKLREKTDEAERKGSEAERKRAMELAAQREEQAARRQHEKEVMDIRARQTEEKSKTDSEKARQEALSAAANADRARTMAEAAAAERRAAERRAQEAQVKNDKNKAEAAREQAEKAEMAAFRLEQERRRAEEEQKRQELAQKKAKEEQGKAQRAAEEAQKEREAADRAMEAATKVRIAAEQSTKEREAQTRELQEKANRQREEAAKTAVRRAAAFEREVEEAVRAAQRARATAEAAQQNVTDATGRASAAVVADLAEAAAARADEAVVPARTASARAREWTPLAEQALDRSRQANASQQIEESQVLVNRASRSELTTEELVVASRETSQLRTREAARLREAARREAAALAAEQDSKVKLEEASKRMQADRLAAVARARRDVDDARMQNRMTRGDLDDSIARASAARQRYQQLAESTGPITEQTLAAMRDAVQRHTEAVDSAKIYVARTRVSDDVVSNFVRLAQATNVPEIIANATAETRPLVDEMNTARQMEETAITAFNAEARALRDALEAQRADREFRNESRRQAIPRDVTVSAPHQPFGMGARMPQYSRVGPLCLLGGAIRTRDMRENPVLATLPAECSPDLRVVYDVHSDVDAPVKTVRVDVTENGELRYVSGSVMGEFLPLDGIAIPVKGRTLEQFPLGPGWSAMDEGTLAPGFLVQNEVCGVFGVVRSSGERRAVVGTLPASCRPRAGLVFHINSNGGTQNVEVSANGEIQLLGTAPPTTGVDWVSLQGIVFTVEPSGPRARYETGSRSLPILSGWSESAPRYSQASFRKQFEFCAAQGWVLRTGNQSHITTLPEECRPGSGTLYFPAWAVSGQSLMLTVGIDGRVSVLGSQIPAALSLSAIRFTVAPEQAWERAKAEQVLAMQRQEAAAAEARRQAEQAQRREEAVPTALVLAAPDFEIFGEFHRVPQWARVQRLCFVSGRVRALASLDRPVTTLPESCRATTETYLPSRTGAAGVAAVTVIFPDGRVMVRSSTATNYVTLDGATVPISARLANESRSVPLKSLPLTSSWTGPSVATERAPGFVRQFGGLCFLTGMVYRSGETFGDVIANVPEECRPDRRLSFVSTTKDGVHHRVDVLPSGNVQWVGTNSATASPLSLDGIMFTTATGTGLDMDAGTTRYDPAFRSASFALAGDVCVVSGFVSTDGASNSLFTLPPACRPSGTMSFSVAGLQGATFVMNVSSDGRVSLARPVATAVSLDGVHFMAVPEQDWESRSSRKADEDRIARETAQRLAEEHAKAQAIEQANKRFTRGATPSPLDLETGFLETGRSYKLPQYAKSGDICFLSGSVMTENSAQTVGSTMTVTPSDCRPDSPLDFVSGTDNMMAFRMSVQPNGQVRYEAGAQGEFVTLTTIVFPTNGSQTTPFPISAPWASSEQSPVRLVREGDFCVLSGAVVLAGGQWSPVIGVLPATCRPEARLIFSVAHGELEHRVDVLPDGSVVWQDGERKYNTLSLSSIHFFPRSTGAIELVNGWRRFSNEFRAPSYVRQRNLCALSGVVSTRGERLIGYLPADCRPNSGNMSYVTPRLQRLDLLSDGSLLWVNGSLQTGGWLSLDGVQLLISVEQTWEVNRARQVAQEQVRRAEQAQAFAAEVRARRAALAQPIELDLQNDFRAYGRGFRLPQFGRYGSICLLSGLTENPSDASRLISQLPPMCRPDRRVAFGVQMEDLNTTRIDVSPNGNLRRAVEAGEGNYYSLDGVTFPIAGSPAANLTLLSPWTTVGGDLGSNVQLVRENRLCVLRGTVAVDTTSQNSGSNAILVLPPPCRPDAILIFNMNNGGSTNRVDVHPNGTVMWVTGPRLSTEFSLNDIAFFPTNAAPLNLSAGWRALRNNFREPGYTRDEAICVLSGVVTGGENSQVAVLPADCRPASGRLAFFVNRDNATERLDVLPDGRVLWMGLGKRQGWLPLDGIRFLAVSEERWETDRAREVAERQRREAEARAAAFLRLATPSPLAQFTSDTMGLFGNGFRIPQYARFGDICMVSGVVGINRTSAGSTFDVFTLGEDCTPQQPLVFNEPSAHHGQAQLLVNQRTVQSRWTQALNSTMLPLEGLSFPLRIANSPNNPTVGAVSLTSRARLLNANFSATFTVQNGFCILDGQIITTEAVTDGSREVVVANLPAECTPADGRLAFASRGVRVDVTTRGEVVLPVARPDVPITLNSIAFFAESRSALPLLNGHTAFMNGFRRPSIRKEGQLCVLSGVVMGSGNVQLANLPAECAPVSGRLAFAVTSSNATFERIDVFANGTLSWVTGLHKKHWVSLDGVYYLVFIEQAWEKDAREGRLAEIARAEAIRAQRMANLARPIRAVLSDAFTYSDPNYRMPQMSRYGSICFVSGAAALENNMIPSGNLTTLFAECSPAFRVATGLYSTRTQAMRVDVMAGGAVVWQGGADRTNLFSFDGMTFPVAGAPDLTPLELGSEWRAFWGNETDPSRSEFGPRPVLAREGGLCVLSGVVAPRNLATLQSGSLIATLPVDCRPREGRLTFAANSHDVSHRVDVTIDGHVLWVSGEKSSAFLSLNNIVFFAQGGAKLALAPGTGWQAYDGVFRDPMFRNEDDVCVVSGMMRSATGSSLLLTLPETCRPSGRLSFYVPRESLLERIDVMRDGRVMWVEGALKEGFISLDGIRFMRTRPEPDWETRIKDQLFERILAEEKVKEEAQKKRDQEAARQRAEQEEKREMAAKIVAERAAAEARAAAEREAVERRLREEAAEEESKSGHRLALASHMEAFGQGYGVPQWVVANGICVLQGVAFTRTLRGSWAELHTTCRPNGTLIFDTHVAGTLTVQVNVNPNGTIAFARADDTVMSGWASFSNIIFPVVRNRMRDIDVDAPWLPISASSLGGFMDPAFMLVDDRYCVLQGAVVLSDFNVNNWRSNIAVLPVACRPNRGTLIFNANRGATTARVDVSSNGQISNTNRGGAEPWLSFSGISFALESESQLLALTGGASPFSESSFRRPSWQKIGDLCVVSGMANTQPTGVIATMTSDCLPPERLSFFGRVDGEMSDRIDVHPDGRIEVVESLNQGHTWRSLDGIRYVVGMRRLRVRNRADEPLGTQNLTLGSAWSQRSSQGSDMQFPVVHRLGQLCFVSGVAGTTDMRSDLTQLPLNCRPDKGRRIFGLESQDGADARMDIRDDGGIAFSGSNDEAARSNWLPLDGLIFAASGSRSVSVAPLPPYVAFNRGYAPPEYVLQGDFCVVSGLVRERSFNAIPGNTILQLPGECRPNDGRLIFKVNHQDVTHRVDVLQDGRVIWIRGSISQMWVELDGIYFFTTSAQNPLALDNAYAPHYGSYRLPSYRVQDRLCAVSGLLRFQGNWPTHTTMAQLPEGCRPARRLIFHTASEHLSQRIDVLPDGRITFISGRRDWGYTSLDGIAFIANAETPIGTPRYVFSEANGTSVTLGQNVRVGEGAEGARVFRTGQLCFWQGSVRPAQMRQVVATVGETCLPANGRLAWDIFTSPNTQARYDLFTNGNLEFVMGSGDEGIVPFNGIVYPVAGTVTQELPLVNQFVAFGGEFAAPTYVVQQGFCVVTGLARVVTFNMQQWENTIANMPAECTPSEGNLIFHTSINENTQRVDVTSSGQVVRNAGSVSAPHISLSGIAFFRDSNEHPISFANPNAYNSGSAGHRRAAWRKQGNLCVLTGLISGNGEPNVATLPTECRPQSSLTFGTAQEGGPQWTQVHANGTIHYRGPRRNWWFSMDGIVFIANGFRSEEETTFVRNITREGTVVQPLGQLRAARGGYRPPMFTALGELCVVSGRMEGANFRSQLVRLPAECRPDRRHVFEVTNGGSSSALVQRVDVNSEGLVQWVAGSSTLDGEQSNWISLDNVMFLRNGTRPLPLTMANFYVSFAGEFQPASYIKLDDLCVVSGLVRDSRQGVEVFPGGALARLPAECRPEGGQLIFATSHNQFTTRLDVQTDGVIVYNGGNRVGPTVALEGIAFLTRSNQLLDLRNGWGQYGGGYRVPQWGRHNNLCVLSGLASGSTRGTLGVLPPQCRPQEIVMGVGGNHDQPALIEVHPDGRVMVVYQNSHGWMSISNVRFVVPERTPQLPNPVIADSTNYTAGELQLSSGFSNYEKGYGTPGFTRWGSLCMLTGAAGGSDMQAASYTTLPANCVPDARLIVQHFTRTSDIFRMDILGGSRPIVRWAGGSRDGNMVTFDGIIFPVAGSPDGPVELAPFFVNSLTDQPVPEPVNYIRQGDYCVVSGVMRVGAQGINWDRWNGMNNLLGTLPVECRPQNGNLMMAINQNERALRADVITDGRILMRGSRPEHLFFSLSGISFFVNGMTGIDLTSGRFWAHREFRAPGYRVQGEFCALSGVAQRNDQSNQVVARLRADCRPHPALSSYVCMSTSNQPIQIDVASDGTVSYRRTNMPNDVSLDCVRFVRAPTA